MLERLTDEEMVAVEQLASVSVRHTAKAIRSLVGEMRAAREDAELANGCLAMIRDVLVAMGCPCGPAAHQTTPAMLYPEWITCVVRAALCFVREACAQVADAELALASDTTLCPRDADHVNGIGFAGRQVAAQEIAAKIRQLDVVKTVWSQRPWRAGGDEARAAVPDSTPDWRIGLSCKPKMRTHPDYYERGTIRKVLPSGTAGIVDPHGVLQIELFSGRVFLAAAEEWMTA